MKSGIVLCMNNNSDALAMREHDTAQGIVLPVFTVMNGIPPAPDRVTDTSRLFCAHMSREPGVSLCGFFLCTLEADQRLLQLSWINLPDF